MYLIQLIDLELDLYHQKYVRPYANLLHTVSLCMFNWASVYECATKIKSTAVNRWRSLKFFNVNTRHHPAWYPTTTENRNRRGCLCFKELPQRYVSAFVNICILMYICVSICARICLICIISISFPFWSYIYFLQAIKCKINAFIHIVYNRLYRFVLLFYEYPTLKVRS